METNSTDDAHKSGEKTADDPLSSRSRGQPGGGILSFLVWGRWRGPSTYWLTRWLFIRVLGGVYLIAFLSYWTQIDGLIGSEGILPAGEYLERVGESLERAAPQGGAGEYWRFPTIFWLRHDDAFLHTMCGVGVGLSLVLMVGMAPVVVLFGLWVIYLSLMLVGQTFLSFQWDILLLETGFLSMFFAPLELLPRFPRSQGRPYTGGLWLLRFLLFKLMFLSGVVKLICLDETWWGLTALDYHYYTQPLPIWTSWYAHHLPAWFQRESVRIMFVIEIGMPFLIFCPRGLRMLACWSLLLLQGIIALTGNYGFFNLLSMLLCLTLLDDAFLLRLLPRRMRERFQGPPASREAPNDAPFFLSPIRLMLAWGVPAALILFSGLTLIREMVRTVPPQGIRGIVGDTLEFCDDHVLSWGRPHLLKWSDPFHSISGYGLFRRMTTSRPEIVIEGSAEGREWREYAFKWKPGELERAPSFVAPHMPRLDWQMWFAALDQGRQAHWLMRLVRRLLEGSPVVLRLLAENPFPEKPPRFIRLVYYNYEFTTPPERRETGRWWKRRYLGLLGRRSFSLADFPK